jgi:tRNA threonylcarbamoyladenosine biosynthesis protein TsaE
METLAYDKNDLGQVAQNLLTYVSEKSNQEGATTLTLAGNLGAGKTTITQQLATVLGVSEVITSPTFVVMKRYQTNHPVFLELIHIDAYRIEQEEEMVVLGFVEWLKKPQTLICIEWPEKISGLIPPSALRVALEVVDENTRKISYG